MFELAKHIIAVANKNNIAITNNKLQKVLFLTFKEILNDEDSPIDARELYDMPFYVWRYGPVVPDIYDTYKVFIGDPILEDNELNDDFNYLNDKILILLNATTTLLDKATRTKFYREHKDDMRYWRSHKPYFLQNINQ